VLRLAITHRWVWGGLVS